MQTEDEAFMHQALELAQKAQSLGEVPVGAVAVKDGQVIGRGFNRREVDQSFWAHAELLAMMEAAKAVGAWRLDGVTVYVTLEPCAMCAGGMVLARIDRLVFGAKDPKAGAAGTLYNLVQDPRHNHRLEVTSGVLEKECGGILSGFFRDLRQKRRTTTE